MVFSLFDVISPDTTIWWWFWLAYGPTSNWPQNVTLISIRSVFYLHISGLSIKTSICNEVVAVASVAVSPPFNDECVPIHVSNALFHHHHHQTTTRGANLNITISPNRRRWRSPKWEECKVLFSALYLQVEFWWWNRSRIGGEEKKT